MNAFFLCLVWPAGVISQELVWQQTNGPNGGACISSIIGDGKGTLLAGTQKAGLYLSRDNGTTWIHSGLDGYFIQSLLLLPGDTLLVAVTGGVLRSTTYGADFEPLLLLDTAVHDLAINSRGELFAAASLQDYPARDGLLFRSSDNGLSWQRVENGLKGTAVTSLLVLSTGRMFAGGASEVRNSGLAGVYYSDDFGDTWHLSDLHHLNISFLLADSAGNVYAGAEGRVFFSTDSGITWQSLPAGLHQEYIYALDFLPNGGLMAATRSGVFRLKDSTWVADSEPFEHRGVLSLFSTKEGYIFAGTYGNGVYRSLDGSGSWQPVNTGMIATTISSLVATREENPTIFAGTDFPYTVGNGVFRSQDHGQSWVQSGLKNVSVICLALDKDGNLFAGTSGGHGVFRSTDNGTSWEEVGLKHTIINSLLILPDQGLLAATYNGLYFSSDQGQRWQGPACPDTLIRQLLLTTQGTIYGLGWGGSKEFLLTSHDLAEHWTRHDLGDYYVSAIGVNQYGDLLLATSFQRGILRSQDGGKTWQETEFSDTSIYVSTFFLSPDDRVYVGTSRGVFVSSDGGQSWIPVNEGLNSTAVLSFLSTRDGYLFAGTRMRGVYRSALPRRKKTFIPSSFHLDQNYPNPFNGKTFLHFFLTKPGTASLQVYDLTGRLVITLFSGNLSSGHHRFVWNASHLPGGIYFYRFHLGGESITRKALLIK